MCDPLAWLPPNFTMARGAAELGAPLKGGSDAGEACLRLG